MYQGMMYSGCEESEALESLRITITGVFCESRVGEGKVLAMVVEECYEVGAIVETAHSTWGASLCLLSARRERATPSVDDVCVWSSLARILAHVPHESGRTRPSAPGKMGSTFSNKQ